MVPKGFIRYQVLESLNEKPMSGSEIINEVESRTNGRWKPSPGSIYPLLAWLQDNGHVKELSTDQGGMKRYEITESGRALLSEQKKIFEEQRKMMDEQRKNYVKFRKEGRFFAPPFIGAPWFGLASEKTAGLRHSVHELAEVFIELGISLEEHFSKQAVEEAQRALEETAEKLTEINRKLKESQDE